jgi:hypothetical protein
MIVQSSAVVLVLFLLVSPSLSSTDQRSANLRRLATFLLHADEINAEPFEQKLVVDLSVLIFDDSLIRRMLAKERRAPPEDFGDVDGSMLRSLDALRKPRSEPVHLLVFHLLIF